MSVFENDAFLHHDSVHFYNDEATGLQAIIAIHSTVLGPALGGCRVVNYANSSEALEDVLRLSRGMSFKNSLAGLELGGGKSVIIPPKSWAGDPRHAGEERANLFRAFGRAVHSLGGRYIAAEDMNVSVEDAENMAQETDYVVGLDVSHGGMGDPSPLTAQGVFLGLRACVRRAFNTGELDGLTVSVQGLGKVGWDVCEQLHAAGAKLIVADIVPQTTARAAKLFGAKIVDTDAIVGVKADVFSPCARGAVINDDTIDGLNVKVVAGSANNQLSHDELGTVLMQRGIIYAPDYVINAGGVINIAPEAKGQVNHEWVREKIKKLEDTVGEIVDLAISSKRSTNEVADEIATRRILDARDAGKAWQPGFVKQPKLRESA
ncbi:MAG: amino acid dehydrogenase [Robiginitomaculum sp.]|nr:MAG: amino acid dehydrogenase [Robiginitomaculum sp.]